MLETKTLNRFRKALRTAMTFQPSRRETLECIMDAFCLDRQDLQTIIDNDEIKDTTTLMGQAQAIAYQIGVKCDYNEDVKQMEALQDLAAIAYSVGYATKDKRLPEPAMERNYRITLREQYDKPMPMPSTAEEAAQLVAEQWRLGRYDYWNNRISKNAKPRWQ